MCIEHSSGLLKVEGCGCSQSFSLFGLQLKSPKFYSKYILGLWFCLNNGFIKNGFTKIRLNLQMDKNLKKNQHSALAFVARGQMVSIIRPSAACKN